MKVKSLVSYLLTRINIEKSTAEESPAGKSAAEKVTEEKRTAGKSTTEKSTAGKPISKSMAIDKSCKENVSGETSAGDIKLIYSFLNSA